VGGWLAWIVHGARRQREAVAVIQRAGGVVQYDWVPNKDGKTVLRDSPWAPKWLVDRIGIDYFGYIRAITLVEATGPSIVAATHFPGLDRLILGGKNLRDADLTPRREVTQFSALSAYITPTSEAGVGGLSRFTNLQFLALVRSGISDKSLVHLERMTKLRILLISGNQAISDAGVAHLRGLTKLRYVDLSDTKITDLGLAQLSKLPIVSYLDLSRTKVSDAGLVHVKDFIRLSTLVVRGTQVTESAASELARAIPRLTVVR
jgi:hypothetical protein